jgi:hypothetical protein
MGLFKQQTTIILVVNDIESGTNISSFIIKSAASPSILLQALILPEVQLLIHYVFSV